MRCSSGRAVLVLFLLLLSFVLCGARELDPTLFWFPQNRPPQHYVELPLPQALRTRLTDANVVSVVTLPSETDIPVLSVSGDVETPLISLSPSAEFPESDVSFRVTLTKVTYESGDAQGTMQMTGPVVGKGNLEEYTAGLLEGLVQTQSGKLVESVSATTAVLDPRTVADTFGRRISRRFVVFQVTVANLDEDFQFLIHDLSLQIPYGESTKTDSNGVKKTSLAPCLSRKAGCQSAVMSSVELSILRGVAEKGQVSSPRNVVLRALKGAGTLGAAFIGIPSSLGPSYAPAVAAFNGPLISAYENVFPDFTINQMNRLNDSAHSTNRIIARQQARVVTGFVSQAFLFSAKDSKLFRDDPHDKLSTLLGIKVNVRGTHIVDLEDVPLLVTDVVFSDPMNGFQSAQPAVKGFVLGHYLKDATLELTTKPDGVSVNVDGESQNSRIDFTVRSEKPVPPGSLLEFAISRGETTTKHSVKLDYQAGQPLVATLAPDEAVPGAGEVGVGITGENFLQEYTTVNVTGLQLVGELEFVGPTELKVKLNVPDNTPAGDYPITVTTPGGTSVPTSFTVRNPITITPTQGVKGAGEIAIAITGQGFVDGQTNVAIEGLERSGDVEFVSPTEVRIKLTVGADASLGAHQITVKVGDFDAEASFTVVQQ